PCEEGYDSSSRKTYKPCPYKPVWEDPTAEKIKIEKEMKGSTTGNAAKAKASEAADSTTSTEDKPAGAGESMAIKSSVPLKT
ncbi:hypothetical protein Pmar_PMAR014374, partial [Perkinsus marinus ATCC 50983]